MYFTFKKKIRSEKMVEAEMYHEKKRCQDAMAVSI